MEELNKNQLVLLCILVSFVVSIATGILTVSLMNEAPTTVTQTINRVVEKTIEKVVPGQVKEVPVIVTEEDLIMKVINNTSSGIASIADSSGKSVATGFFVADNLVISNILGTTTDKTYSVLVGKRKFDAQIVDKSLAGIIVLKTTKETTEKSILSLDLGKEDKPITVLKLSDGGPVVGQTVVGIDSKSVISVGIVSSLDQEASSTVAITNAATDDNHGGPVLNIRGEVVGVSKKQGVSISSKNIKAVLDTIK